jgi:serine/threonine-protein kinase RsbW
VPRFDSITGRGDPAPRDGAARPGWPGPEPVASASAGGPAPQLLIALPALPTSTRAVRQRLRGWLSAWGWPDDDLDDIIIAVEEAVANVVDHAYRAQPVPGDVRVYAWITALRSEQRVTVSVTDRGRWRPIPEDPGYRGRGLLMMSTCMSGLHIEHNAGGTSVTLSSNPVPARNGSR